MADTCEACDDPQACLNGRSSCTLSGEMRDPKTGRWYPPHERLEPATKLMLDLSTSHIKNRDRRLAGAIGGLSVRMQTHDYGLIVFVSYRYDDIEGHNARLQELREVGFSPQFVSIYDMACHMPGYMMLINFDACATVIEGMAQFNGDELIWPQADVG